VKAVRLRLPQIGGRNLWRLLNRFASIVKLPPIGRDRLASLLLEANLKVKWPKARRVQTTYSGHPYAVQPNLLKDFHAVAPNQVWVADITYISVEDSPAYLFLITDQYSRKIVGHHIARSLHATGAIKALQVALATHQPPRELIHHSDRGVQYCCHDFLDQIQGWELRSSMTDTDHCAQNALAECMNGILKREFLLGLSFPDFPSACRAIEDAIATYNTLRIHGSLNALTPSEVHSGNVGGAINAWFSEILAFYAPRPAAA
jgi:putative transposase